MKAQHLIAVLTVAFVIAAAPSKAAVYNFSYNGIDQFDKNLPFSASGQFITTDTLVGGAYTIISISGERNSVPISKLDPLSYVGGNDNLFYPAGPYFDFLGLAYNTNNLDYNLYYDSSLGVYAESSWEPGSNFTNGNVVTLSITPISTPVPEPSSLILLAGGLLAIWLTGRQLRASGPG